MPVLITKKFKFEAAHYLPTMPEGHKCTRVHGHNFKVEVNLMGDIDPKTGFLVDFGEIKKIVNPFIDTLDHLCLNEVGEELDDDLLRIPSTENLAKWFFTQLNPLLPGLYSIVVHETDTSRCEYRESFS
ncbi:MAG: 6-carboxytetrahydropterin synthase QueD [Bacteroidota bacterium]